MCIKGLEEFIKEKELDGMFIVAYSIDDNMLCNFILIEAYPWGAYQFKGFHEEIRDAFKNAIKEGNSYELYKVYKINAEEVK